MPHEKMTRRVFIHRLLTTAAFAFSWYGSDARVLADEAGCPNLKGKRIRWIVPHAPGGGYDTYSRLIAPFYAKELQAEISIDNIPGAGGMVGAQTIKGADPDGLTIGILDGSGFVVASLAGEKNAPDIANDFTVLGRLARSRQVWAVHSASPLRPIKEVFTAAREKPLVFGTLNVASLSFCNIVVTSHLLGVQAEVVSGYRGSKAGVLAVQRGEVEIISYSFESILRHIESGDITPILQISDKPISSHPALRNVPVLGGPDGIAVLRAKELGHNPTEAQLDAQTLSAIVSVGRLMVAPMGLDTAQSNCLKHTLQKTLANPEVKTAAAKAKRSLDVGDARTVQEALLSVSRRADVFRGIIQKAIAKVRS